MAQRIFTFMLLIIMMASIARADDLAFVKSNFDYSESDPYITYDFKNKTSNLMTYEWLNDRQVEVSIWKRDCLQVDRKFTITLPQEYKIRYDGFNAIGKAFGKISTSDGPYIYIVKNLFSKSGYFECVLNVYDNSDNKCSIIIDETSKILGVYKGNLGEIAISPDLIDGTILFESGVIVKNNNDSGIYSINADSTPSSVSPNPSNGAASVELSWDYTLLDDAQLNVINMEGKLVHTQTIKSGSRKTNLSTSHFASGSYIYVVQGSNGYTSSGKLIIN